jgi:hypothetical protein
MTVEELILELRRFRSNDLVKIRIVIIDPDGDSIGFEDDVASVDGAMYCRLLGTQQI